MKIWVDQNFLLSPLKPQEAYFGLLVFLVTVNFTPISLTFSVGEEYD